MKTSLINKYAMLALLSTSFIALNNCGNQSDSTKDQAYSAEQNGPASDFALLGHPPAGYPVVAGTVLPINGVETNCNDGVDNEGDGLTDCMDSDCAIHPECSEFGPPLEEVVNSRALTIYPNGVLVPEDLAILNARAADADDPHGWQRDGFFATSIKDCWVAPIYQDPYYNVQLGAPLVAGPYGAIGPQLPGFPADPRVVGPRAGLIDECEAGTDIFTYHMDDDNGFGAGASGDYGDEEGGNGDDTEE